MLLLTLASLLAQPAPCVHDLASPRPHVTLAEQAETRRTIRIAVDQLGGSPDFAALLLLVAARESSSQRGLVHRLQADQDATARAWRKLAKVYADSPHADDPARWQAYGLFGMNSPIFTMIWDPQADPAVLCDPLVDVMVYQRAAARVVAKLQRTGRCAPTWGTIHTAVSGGKLCPAKISADFRRRAARAGIDPDAPVNLANAVAFGNADFGIHLDMGIDQGLGPNGGCAIDAGHAPPALRAGSGGWLRPALHRARYRSTP